MQNTTTTVIAICLAATLLFVAPLVSLTERNDNVVQENVELLVNEFVTDVQNTGIISQAKYQSLENSLAATGNTYNVAIKYNGDVYGWGDYYHGLQNVKTMTNSRIPVKIGMTIHM